MNESDNKKMKIVLVTTGQPSVNPRIVKEADALSFAGYDVTIMYCHWITWADESDKAIIENAKWKAILVGGSPTKQRIKFYYTKLRFKICRFLNKRNIRKFLVAEKAQARCYTELLNVASSIKSDIFIGHNLGALPVVVNAAATQKVKCGFDFEDYHRGEVKQMNGADAARIKYLEYKYLPACNYISFASPLIAKRQMLHFPKFKRPAIVINNCFPLSSKAPAIKSDGTLNLFWFSQTVGTDRGLVTVLLAMKLLKNTKISLTLAGNIGDETLMDFQNILSELSAQLIIKGVVSPAEIDKLAAQADVGLAIEQSIPINRDICLTNKVFTYLSAGLAIVFTDTSAQKEFNALYKVGQIYEQGNVEALAKCLEEYLNSQKLYQQKLHNWQLAKDTLNWQQESKKLLKILN